MPVVVEVPDDTNKAEPENDTPKVPLWKAALKQKKEAKEKKENEEQKKLVSTMEISYLNKYQLSNYILW